MATRLKRVGWCVGVWCAGMALYPCAEAAVFINEVLADPPAAIGDANGDGAVGSLDDEFVELVNTGAAPVVLGGWRIADSAQVRHIFAAGDSIPGYGFTVVFGSTASSGGLSLNNGGDTVSLRDATLALIDQMVYGAEGGHDTSLTRSPDGAGGFAAHLSISSAPFSPGHTAAGDLFLPHEEPVAPDEITLPEEVVTPERDEPSTTPSVPEPGTWLLWTLGMTQFQRSRRRSIMSRCDEKIPAGHRYPRPLGDRGDWGLHRHV